MQQAHKASRSDGVLCMPVVGASDCLTGAWAGAPRPGASCTSRASITRRVAHLGELAWPAHALSLAMRFCLWLTRTGSYSVVCHHPGLRDGGSMPEELGRRQSVTALRPPPPPGAAVGFSRPQSTVQARLAAAARPRAACRPGHLHASACSERTRCGPPHLHGRAGALGGSTVARQDA